MSASHVVLLRAVNVGGAKLPMAGPRELAADLGSAPTVSIVVPVGHTWTIRRTSA